MAIIDRTGASALIPQDSVNEIFQGITENSAILSLATRLPNMTTKQLNMPVLNALPHAYFVNGDTGLKETTSADWQNKVITAEEIAVIVPVPDAVLDDSSFDIWTQIRPLVNQAFGQVIDRAILYGTNKPASWPNDIYTGATNSDKIVTPGTGTSYQDIMGPDGLIALVEQSGYMVSGYVGAMQARGMLRGITDENGQPIFRQGMTDSTAYTIDGAPVVFPRNGAIDPAKSLLVAGDYSQIVYSIRQDMTYKLLSESVITDSSNQILYNLAQQDMSAMRFVMRLGWQLPNPVNALTEDGTKRYPFSILKPAV